MHVVFFPALIGILGVLAIAATYHEQSLIFLPGTQPGNVDDMQDFRICASCHSGPVTIGKDWYGSMMAHSARDPLFYAAMAVANKYENSSGEWCMRCHAPGGWLAGRSNVPTGDDLRGTDLDGVQCDYCHRSIDPLSPDSLAAPSPLDVPGYGNAMHIFQKTHYPKRGPYTDALNAHAVKGEPFQRGSDLCGVCHDISNPFQTDDQDRLIKSPHEYGPIERTYSEWLMSDFPAMGESGSCLSCHMSIVPGYGSSVSGSPYRNDLRQHDLTGANTFVPAILSEFWEGLDTAALNAGIERARQTLRRAADVRVHAVRREGRVEASVIVENLTGHKLPTGYPEGRRMWLEVIGTNADSHKVFHSGLYLRETGELRVDPQLKVYEVRRGLTERTASRFSLQPGPSNHFILTDTVLSDNRIPPRGFTNTKFRERNAAPVAYTYEDGQHYDVTKYSLPLDVNRVTVALYYQTASREYIEFLRDENAENIADTKQWGQRLYSAWERNGKSSPELIASASAGVPDTITSINDYFSPDAAAFRLHQNFPNPFNSSTSIRFELPSSSTITLELYDLSGKKLRTLVSAFLKSGSHEYQLDAGEYPSGVYMISLRGDTFSSGQKIILAR